LRPGDSERLASVRWNAGAPRAGARHPGGHREQDAGRASIAAALAAEGINLDAVLQEPGYPKGALAFMVTVEPCKESALDAAIRSIAGAEYHSAPPLALPMLPGV
jgi:hypothetical protein